MPWEHEGSPDLAWSQGWSEKASRRKRCGSSGGDGVQEPGEVKCTAGRGSVPAVTMSAATQGAHFS